jgi:hypothetical protein
MCRNYVKKGNIKTGLTIGTISKLYGDDMWYIPKLGISVKGTCSGCCGGCKGSCYVASSYRYDSVKYSHAVTTIAQREDIVKFWQDVSSQISRKRNPFEFLRGNQSGELESDEEFLGYCKVAREHPNLTVYLYTKRYDIVYRNINKIPTNFMVNLSIWGNYGIEEYKNLSEKSDRIKAFVYLTREFTAEWYASKGIDVVAICGAYDRNGKMNHEITCDKCKLCMNPKARVVGCYDHSRQRKAKLN